MPSSPSNSCYFVNVGFVLATDHEGWSFCLTNNNGALLLAASRTVSCTSTQAAEFEGLAHVICQVAAIGLARFSYSLNYLTVIVEVNQGNFLFVEFTLAGIADRLCILCISMNINVSWIPHSSNKSFAHMLASLARSSRIVFSLSPFGF